MLDNPRLELLIGKYGRTLVILLVVVATASLAVGGWYMTATAEKTVSQTVGQQQVRTTATDRAVVVDTGNRTRNGSRTANGATTNGSAANETEPPLWEPGTVLRDQPVYLLGATPNVTVGATTRVSGAQEATVTHQWTLVYEASRDGEVFWTNRTVLSVAQTAGTELQSNATVDMLRVFERVSAIQNRIGSAGVVSVKLVLTVGYETGSYEGTKTTSSTVELETASYAVGDGLGWQQAHSRTVQTTVEEPREGTLPMVLILFGLVAGGLAAAISLQDPKHIDPERARNRIHRRQYAQWISPGQLPFDLDMPYIELESLEDLVDVAIDTQERVVHDKQRDLFAVIAENALYYHSMEADWSGTAFPEITQPSEGVGEFDSSEGEEPEVPNPEALEGDGGDGFGFGEFLPGEAEESSSDDEGSGFGGLFSGDGDDEE